MSERHERSKLCVELAEKISEYLDEELPPELKLEVEAHVEGCSACEKFVDSVRRTRDLAHLLPPLELPPERMREISDKVRRELSS